VVELVEVQHVAKDDVLFVDDAWRDLLNTAGHLPQVGLETTRRTTHHIYLVVFLTSDLSTTRNSPTKTKTDPSSIPFALPSVGPWLT
jgi:hypothetical protein